jgi:hypothetical protein
MISPLERNLFPGFTVFRATKREYFRFTSSSDSGELCFELEVREM